MERIFACGLIAFNQWIQVDLSQIHHASALDDAVRKIIDIAMYARLFLF